jgi:signal transduction histidine kinase
LNLLIKRTYFLVLVLLVTISFAQTGIETTLDRIEVSQNFDKNLSELKQINSSRIKDKEIYTKLKGLIITNHLNKNQLDSALKLALQEVEKSKRLGDAFCEGRFTKWIGNVYFYLQEEDTAIHYWQKSLAIAKTVNDDLTLGQCFSNIGSIVILREGGKPAAPYFLKAIEHAKKVKCDNTTNINKNYRLLASAYETSNQLEKADSLYRMILTSYKDRKDTLGWTEAAMFYCSVLSKTNRLEKGIALNDSIITITRKAKNYEMLSTALTLLAQNLQGAKRYERVHSLMYEAITVNQKRSSQILRGEIAKYESQFKLREINYEKEQSIKLERQQRNIYLLIFLSIFLICIFLVIFYYRRKQSQIKQEQVVSNLKAIYEAQENERLRIAKDLHDNMGAYTTSILAQIEMMENTRLPDSPNRLASLRFDAEHIMSTLRETIWILKTKHISVSDFFDLIKSYVNKQLRVNLNYEVIFNESIEHNITLNATVSLNLFRIIQEATQNIIKHADATHVTYTFHVTPSVLKITVMDNGKGFDTGKTPHQNGLGNMMHRAEEVNFTYHIHSELGNGTTITLLQAHPKNTH